MQKFQQAPGYPDLVDGISTTCRDCASANVSAQRNGLSYTPTRHAALRQQSPTGTVGSWDGRDA
ncbi:MAG: hypothetical protein O2964_19945, partial [Verrucomicrobia bacterium]|nr:hypothetical protein [Verrucomicrobiota bacterium]